MSSRLGDGQMSRWEEHNQMDLFGIVSSALHHPPSSPLTQSAFKSKGSPAEASTATEASFLLSPSVFAAAKDKSGEKYALLNLSSMWEKIFFICIHHVQNPNPVDSCKRFLGESYAYTKEEDNRDSGTLCSHEAYLEMEHNPDSSWKQGI